MAKLDADKIADLIEARMDVLLDAANKPRMPKEPPETVEDRKRLFRAIAWGVIEHLKDNPDAFKLQATGVAGITVRMTAIEKEP
jgi:hypothetical protein